MKPLIVKTQTTPVSGRFLLFHVGDGGVWNRELTSFRCAGAEDTWLHYTRIEALSPARWRLHRACSGLVRPTNLEDPFDAADELLPLRRNCPEKRLGCRLQIAVAHDLSILV